MAVHATDSEAHREPALSHDGAVRRRNQRECLRDRTRLLRDAPAPDHAAVREATEVLGPSAIRIPRHAVTVHDRTHTWTHDITFPRFKQKWRRTICVFRDLGDHGKLLIFLLSISFPSHFVSVFLTTMHGKKRGRPCATFSPEAVRLAKLMEERRLFADKAGQRMRLSELDTLLKKKAQHAVAVLLKAHAVETSNKAYWLVGAAAVACCC